MIVWYRIIKVQTDYNTSTQVKTYKKLRKDKYFNTMSDAHCIEFTLLFINDGKLTMYKDKV